MPETTDETFDLDAWLDGAKRTERAVTVYGRVDLMADIDLLEAKAATLGAIPDGDRAMGGDNASPLLAKIDALYLQMDASKLVLRVQALTDLELEAIRTKVSLDLVDTLAKVTEDARLDAKAKCARADSAMGKNDINSIMRNAAAAAEKVTIDQECDIRAIAKAVVSPSMDADRVRKLVDRIGDKQYNMIKAAYSRAVNEEPRVQLPKSPTPSRNDDGAMSS